MRYFITTNALRPLVAAGRSFEFEPVSLRGGTWLGILAVDDELAAGILASGASGVDEISTERFDGLKKKPTSISPNYRVLPTPPPDQRGVAVAEPAARRIAPTTAEPAKPQASITLQTTTAQPPFEALLVGAGKTKKRAV
jgi:hypothetical protein